MATLIPMLAELEDIANLESYITNAQWWMQQKFDGQRVLFVVEGGVVKVLNRKGGPKVTFMTKPLLAQFEVFAAEQGPGTGTWVLDGELLDGCVHLFDLAEAAGVVTSTTPYHERLLALELLVTEQWQPDPKLVQVVSTARTPEEKRRLVEVTRAEQSEGVIARDIDGPYECRRTHRMRKLKYTHDADFIVTELGRDGKENAVLSLLDPANSRVVEVGTVSTIGKRPAPKVGDVWEVRYQHFTDAEEKLFSPRLMRLRDDKDLSECLVDQLVRTNKAVIQKDRLLL